MVGPGPSETIVEVDTINGPVEIIVDVEQVIDDNLLVVESIFVKNGSTLVELPRESISGQSRVWVSTDSTVRESHA
jgi:hypothetical protein